MKIFNFYTKLKYKLNNLNIRREWVISQLLSLPEGSKLLDAGCGSQQFRIFCNHLNYYGQDFAGYVNDDKKMLGQEDGGAGGKKGYQYGSLDYIGDIWNIDEDDSTFDTILCTEVLEHIPYPIEALKEFHRLLKTGGKLILTAPSNSLRHMDPYYFYSGFSDRWYQKILSENGFQIDLINPVGDYYSWLSVEIARTAKTHSLFAKFILLPAFIFYFYKRKTDLSINTLCSGYHVLATKI